MSFVAKALISKDRRTLVPLQKLMLRIGRPLCVCSKTLLLKIHIEGDMKLHFGTSLTCIHTNIFT